MNCWEHAMKAVAIDDFGAPPSLHDLPVPEPGEGEVLVRVRASSVNGFDVAVAGGYRKGGYPGGGLAAQDGLKTRPGKGLPR
jgi:NADPH:quinone reductase-like Zn-dependent oxidoreductase